MLINDNNRLVLLFSLSAVMLVTACCGIITNLVPERPTNVPPEAVWSGGVDGGSWILCSPLDERRIRYACKTYNDFNGTMSSDGEYILMRIGWNAEKQCATYTEVNEFIGELNYNGFDGRTIRLRDSLGLINPEVAKSVGCR